MSTLKDILDIGLKYGPEAANYFTGQRRLDQKRKDLREEMFPKLQRKNLSASQQALSNRANENPNAAAINDLEAATTGALNISGNTKGGRGMLADILRGSANARAKIETSGDAITNSRLRGAGANEESVMDYNRSLSDKEEIYDLQKGRQLDYLGDQEKRLKGKAGGSLFDMASDISSLFPKKKSTEDGGDVNDGEGSGTAEGGDVNDLLGMLNAAEGPEAKTQEAEHGSAAFPLDLEEIDMPADNPSALDEMFDVFNRGIDFNEGGAVVTPDGYDHDGVDILMTDRSNGQPLGTVESAEMIVNASDAKKGIALAKKNPKSPTSKWFLQLAKRFEKEAKNRK